MCSTSKNTDSWNDTFSNIALVLARGFSSPRDFTGEDPRYLERLDVAAWPALDAARSPWLAEWEKAVAEPDSVLLAYSRLFLGPYEIQAMPYASHYLDPARRLMSETSLWVAEAYAEAGLVPPEDRPSDAPDHLCLECEFLYYLGYQASSTGEAEWNTRITNFLNNHFLLWVPQCADAILRADTSPYHLAAARFLKSWLEEFSCAVAM